MMDRKFDDDLAKEYIEKIFPMPSEPIRAKMDKRVRSQYLSRVGNVKNARMKIAHLRLYGKGTGLPGIKGSLWGTFNAVLEYVDHYGKDGELGISSSLFGSGAARKRKAFDSATQYLS